MAELKTREPFSTSWPDEKGRTQGAEEGGISEIKGGQKSLLTKRKSRPTLEKHRILKLRGWNQHMLQVSG